MKNNLKLAIEFAEKIRKTKEILADRKMANEIMSTLKLFGIQHKRIPVWTY